MNRSPPNLAYRVASPTWLSMPNFLAIGLGVLNLWGVKFCHIPISRRSPLTQCWVQLATHNPLSPSDKSGAEKWHVEDVSCVAGAGSDRNCEKTSSCSVFIHRLPVMSASVSQKPSRRPVSDFFWYLFLMYFYHSEHVLKCCLVFTNLGLALH